MPSTPDLTIDALLSHATSLRALARGLLGGDEHAAEDVVQETWIAALEQRPARDIPLGGWLKGVARHLALKRRREEGRRTDREWSAAREEPLAGVDSDLAQREVLRRLVDAVLGLDPMYRQVVLMRYFQDLPPREIAQQLDTPVATVDHRLHRAKKKLRQRLDADAGGERRQWASALAAATGWQVSKNSGGSAMSWSLMAGAATVVTATVVATTWPSRGKTLPVEAGGVAQARQAAVALEVPATNEQEVDPGPQREPIVSATEVEAELRSGPELSYPYRLEGRVVDPEDQGVAYSEVWVVPIGHPLDQSVPADAQGRFAITWDAASPELEVLVWVDQAFIGYEPAPAQRLKLKSGSSQVRTVLVPKTDAESRRRVLALTEWVSEEDRSARGRAAGETEHVFRWPLPLETNSGEVLGEVVELSVAPSGGSFELAEESVGHEQASRQSVSVEGTVYAADGSPAAGAILMLQDEQGEDLRRVATTDEEGRYSFEQSTGRYRLRAGGGRFGLASTELVLEIGRAEATGEIAALQTHSWSPILDRGQEIHGRLRLEDGAKADNWLVTLLSEDERSLTLDATLTEDGRFALPNVTAGGRLLLSPPGSEFAAQVVEVAQPGQEPLEIVIPSSQLALGTLRLTLTAPGPEWQPELWVLQLESGRLSWLLPTEDAGQHELELPAGTYRVVAGTAQHGFLDLGQVQVESGEEVELTATLPEPGTVTWTTSTIPPEDEASVAEWTLYRLGNGVASQVGSGLVSRPPAAPLPAGEYALYLEGREIRFRLPPGAQETLELQQD